MPVRIRRKYRKPKAKKPKRRLYTIGKRPKGKPKPTVRLEAYPTMYISRPIGAKPRRRRRRRPLG